jgi:hypothetical protein
MQASHVGRPTCLAIEADRLAAANTCEAARCYGGCFIAYAGRFYAKVKHIS